MLYFEAHVTIEPVFGEQLEYLDKICKQYEFKVAELLMKKEREATEVRSDKDTFTSAKSHDLKDITERTVGLVDVLQDSGFEVYRYKIEAAILDSNISDSYRLLNDEQRQRIKY